MMVGIIIKIKMTSIKRAICGVPKNDQMITFLVQLHYRDLLSVKV